MNSSATHIDIVLPCYNPHPGWEENVISNMQKLYEVYPFIIFTLYIVPDGSKRGHTADTKKKIISALPRVNFVDYPSNQGKGYAVRAGVAQCTSEYVIYTDYDFPYTDISLYQVIESLLTGVDVVVAVRDRNYQKNLPLFRRFLSNSSHWINRLLLGLRINDTQGGLKGFNRKGRDIFLSTQINSFLFDTEFIYKAAHRKDIRIQAVKTRIKDGLAVSEMGFKVIRKELKNFLIILRNK